MSARRSGIRITLTTHLGAADITGLVDAIATELPRALAAEGATRDEVADAFAGRGTSDVYLVQARHRARK